jgi:hypothetical protein
LTWLLFFQLFNLSQCLFLLMRCISCRQYIVGPSFWILFANWCLLMGELSPLMFSVSSDRYVVIPVS